MPTTPPGVTGVLETVLYFTEESRTERFYTSILGFRLVGREPGRSLFYRAGGSVFLLFEAAETLRGERLPPHGATGPGHTCFLADERGYERFKAHLAEHDVPILQEVRWNDGALSFYFHDPDLNLLEIANRDLWPA